MSSVGGDSEQQKAVKELYRHVIDAVVEGSRQDFLTEGVDEDVLLYMQQLWESKLAQIMHLNQNGEGAAAGAAAGASAGAGGAGGAGVPPSPHAGAARAPGGSAAGGAAGAGTPTPGTPGAAPQRNMQTVYTTTGPNGQQFQYVIQDGKYIPVTTAVVNGRTVAYVTAAPSDGPPIPPHLRVPPDTQMGKPQPYVQPRSSYFPGGQSDPSNLRVNPVMGAGAGAQPQAGAATPTSGASTPGAVGDGQPPAKRQRVPQTDGGVAGVGEDCEEVVTTARRVRADAWLLSQLDGAGDGGRRAKREEGDAAEAASTGDGEAGASGEGEEDEDDLLGSDLDDSDDELDTKDLMLAQFDRVQRVRNKWKCQLRDGMVKVGNKDYVFKGLTGELEWA